MFSMSAIVSNILAALFAFLIVIGIHEFGHFLVAQWVGVKVLRFNIGFGKPFALKKAKSDIEYGISPFLLGGYVKLLDEREGKVSPELLSQSMTRQPLWKRLSILGAGPGMNLLLAIILFVIVLTNGLPILKPVVGEIIPTSLAEKAGFQKGDVFLKVENAPAANWMIINFKLIDAFGEDKLLNFTVRHSNGQKSVLKIPVSEWKLDPIKPNLLVSLGIRPAIEPTLMTVQKENIRQAFITSVSYMWSYAKTTGDIFYKIARGVLSIRALSGPISLWIESAQSLKKGWIYYTFFLGFLSVSMGVVNLLPYPGLDGFQMVLAIVEKVIKRPISTALQLLIYRLGLIALAILLIQVVLNDIERYLLVS